MGFYDLSTSGADAPAAPMASVNLSIVAYALVGVAALSAAAVAFALVPDGALRLAAEAVLLAAPLAVLSLVLYSPASFEVDHPRGGRFVNSAVLIAPGAMLLACSGAAQVDYVWLLVIGALAGGTVLAAAWAIKDRAGLSGPRAFAGVAGLFAAAYAVFAVWFVDARFDTKPPTSLPTQVLDKWVTHGRGGGYNLRLAAWGPKDAPNTVSVNYRLYEQVNAGDEVCVALHPGALGLPWYQVLACS